MKRRLQMLPETIQLQKDQIKFLKQEVNTLCYRLTNLVDEIASKSEDLNQDLIQATTTVFPAYDAARTASIDLLAAAIEASLIKLSLTKARSERALYNHNPGQKRNKEGRNVAQAITTAFGVLEKDEKDAKIEISSLDRQLEGYETLLNLVDGGKGGYQQIINDWTKVKQETDECLKDLRRLGWTGD
ncbi:hypothetical protein CVT25_010140 [Psilocybe cyanescens]|uniref:Uncharacterized protein n=1 Tax=Psilocybe cyanescens TaxID=93625 RepID=A0A409XJ39_PSICY|nr:hypothetical protein CVT25_010140 [Psilocybe cyanescens]